MHHPTTTTIYNNNNNKRGKMQLNILHVIFLSHFQLLGKHFDVRVNATTIWGRNETHTHIYKARVCVCVCEGDRLTWPHDQRFVGLYTCRCVLNWKIAASNRIKINFQFELVSTSLFSNILLIGLRHARCERQWRTLPLALFFYLFQSFQEFQQQLIS